MTSLVQKEEMEAMKAIYDLDFHSIEGAITSFSIGIHSDDGTLSTELNVSLPDDYPKCSPPVYQLKTALWLDSDDKTTISANLRRIFIDNNGEVVIYQWVEWIRNFMNMKAEQIASTRNMEEVETNSTEIGDRDEVGAVFATHGRALKTKAQASSSNGGMEIFHGEPLTDRKSTFQAHVTSVSSQEEVEAFVTQLKSSKKIATATHNILAYRIYISSRDVFQQDYDEDGETAAGGRLLHLLQIMNVQNVAVVVTRWYGGILLHADRFKHINNVARIVIQESGIGLQHHDVKSTKKTKART